MTKVLRKNAISTGRVLTLAEVGAVSGGNGKVTKQQAVAQANATADTMIAILKKYHVI